MIAACGQMEATTIEQAGRAWDAVHRLAGAAKEAGADLLVLPEATYPAYWLESAERYWQDDIERTATVLKRYAEVAARHGFWLIAGFVEEDDSRLYNSAAVIDRTGRLVGIARKNFLWDCDHRWFTAGKTIEAVDTEFGRLGVLICADARMPEIPATLVGDGAGLLVQPTAWVNTSKVRRTYRNIQPDFLIRARTMEFGVPFVSASKSGREGAVLEYVGQSQIVQPDGSVSAKAPLGGEQLVCAEVHPAYGRPVRMDAETRQRLLSEQPPFRPDRPGGRCAIRPDADAASVIAEIGAAGGRTIGMMMPQMDGFAAARRHALDGAQVLVVEGRVVDDTLVRARAAENRVFVVVVAEVVQRVIDPDGTVLWRRGDWTDGLELDLAQADTKQFNPQTDIWRQRRVQSYRFPAEPGD